MDVQPETKEVQQVEVIRTTHLVAHDTVVDCVGEITLDECKQLMWKLTCAEKCCQWYLGWCWNYMHRKWTREAEEFIPLLGYKKATLTNYGSVCSCVKISTRVHDLSFFHHRAIAACTPTKQHRWLRAAKKNKWSVARLRKEVKTAERKEAEEEAVAEVSEEARTDISKVCEIRHCSMEELFASGVRPNVVLTDPPYPREFLPLYGKLAECCAEVEVPTVAVMCGQSYLPEVLRLMCEHLRYRWTLAYLTPGGQAVQQWEAKVNTFWKPVLLFGEAQDWIGDVAKSEPNDNDKRFHDWGQSESGMADLVRRLTKPGDWVCDPFLGAGTTAVACLALGRKFIGCDIDAACAEQSIRRCELIYGNGS